MGRGSPRAADISPLSPITARHVTLLASPVYRSATVRQEVARPAANSSGVHGGSEFAGILPETLVPRSLAMDRCLMIYATVRVQ